ncbi:MAG: response regulator transcription factor [Peptococcaceae bacterium]|nr:response regulator transcription factor [Peptococcaceae bacterium]
MAIKVMIVDDQRLMREGLKTILELEQDLQVIQLAENGQDALVKLTGELPDVVLMDIRMPVMDGVACTAAIKQKHPQIKVLILTTFDDDEFIVDALNNGALGYILKDLSSEKLISCIRDLHDGNAIMQPEIAARIISLAAHAKKDNGGTSHPSNHTADELTEREKTVLQLVGKGFSNLEIAKKLYISEGTVKNYISSLYAKTGINERSKLTLYATRRE